ncbi:hypothetical protein ACXR0O_19185 [Verrucomicrobiota bacterium sgz303538]
MKKGQKIYSLEALTSDELATRNTQLFAALTSFGIEPETELCGEYVESVGGQTVSATVWRLKERSNCGKWDTGELIKLWNSPDLDQTHPDHPIAHLRAGFRNYAAAVRFLKDQGPIAIKRRGKRIALISRHTTPERRAKILEGLNK